MHEHIIRKNTKLYVFDNKLYKLNLLALIKAIEKKQQYSNATLTTWLELVANDTKSKARTAARVNNVLRGGDETIGINTVRLLGLALAGNDMEFLEEIKLDELTDALINRSFEKNVENIKGIYQMFYDVLYEIIDSCFFNYIPNTKIDGFNYYERRIDKIRGEINKIFLNNQVHREKLLNISNEIELFIKSYSIPGVCKRWKEINPAITFYDVVYDIYYENRTLYERIKACNLLLDEDNYLLFDFIPNDEQIKQREIYFEKVDYQNKLHNLRYTNEIIFRNELLKTLTMVFEHDFDDFKAKEKK